MPRMLPRGALKTFLISLISISGPALTLLGLVFSTMLFGHFHVVVLLLHDIDPSTASAIFAFWALLIPAAGIPPWLVFSRYWQVMVYHFFGFPPRSDA